jgi:hypothetical protein
MTTVHLKTQYENVYRIFWTCRKIANLAVAVKTGSVISKLRIITTTGSGEESFLYK